MAWNTNNLMEFIEFLIRKNQAGGVTPKDFFYTWNSEQKSYQDDLLGRFQRSTNEKTGANTGLIQNETILTKLTPFTQNVPLIPISGDAVTLYDFIYTLAIRAYGYKVFNVSKDQIWAVNDDVIDPPSNEENSYYYTEYKNFFRFLP